MQEWMHNLYSVTWLHRQCGIRVYPLQAATFPSIQLSLWSRILFNDVAFIFQCQRKGYINTLILGSIWYVSLLLLDILHVCICILQENILFSTLILGSVFSEYVVFYGMSIYCLASDSYFSQNWKRPRDSEHISFGGNLWCMHSDALVFLSINQHSY